MVRSKKRKKFNRKKPTRRRKRNKEKISKKQPRKKVRERSGQQSKYNQDTDEKGGEDGTGIWRNC